MILLKRQLVHIFTLFTMIALKTSGTCLYSFH
jgi:hypothetical protein